jgi:hypothetical protein
VVGGESDSWGCERDAECGEERVERSCRWVQLLPPGQEIGCNPPSPPPRRRTPHTRHWSWRQPGPSPHPSSFIAPHSFPPFHSLPHSGATKMTVSSPGISVRIQDQNILRADSFPSDPLTCVKLQPLVGSHPLSFVRSRGPLSDRPLQVLCSAINQAATPSTPSS